MELKTSKHEFTDIIHQNKQGIEGKKRSGKEFGKEFIAFEQNMCWTVAESAIGTQDSNCFLT